MMIFSYIFLISVLEPCVRLCRCSCSRTRALSAASKRAASAWVSACASRCNRSRILHPARRETARYRTRRLSLPPMGAKSRPASTACRSRRRARAKPRGPTAKCRTGEFQRPAAWIDWMRSCPLCLNRFGFSWGSIPGAVGPDADDSPCNYADRRRVYAGAQEVDFALVKVDPNSPRRPLMGESVRFDARLHRSAVASAKRMSSARLGFADTPGEIAR